MFGWDMKIVHFFRQISCSQVLGAIFLLTFCVAVTSYAQSLPVPEIIVKSSADGKTENHKIIADPALTQKFDIDEVGKTKEEALLNFYIAVTEMAVDGCHDRTAPEYLKVNFQIIEHSDQLGFAEESLYKVKGSFSLICTASALSLPS